MSKKNALGEINLDFEESINTINGIPITPSISEEKQEKAKQKKESDMLSKLLDEKQQKAVLEQKLTDLEKQQKDKKEDIAEAKEKVKEMGIDPKYLEAIKNDLTKDEQKKTDNKPSTKKHLKIGYTRHTFAIKDEQLELIRAIALYKGIEQKQLLESLLNKAFESIDEKTKENALKCLYAEDKEIDIFN